MNKKKFKKIICKGVIASSLLLCGLTFHHGSKNVVSASHKIQPIPKYMVGAFRTQPSGKETLKLWKCTKKKRDDLFLLASGRVLMISKDGYVTKSRPEGGDMWLKSYKLKGVVKDGNKFVLVTNRTTKNGVWKNKRDKLHLVDSKWMSSGKGYAGAVGVQEVIKEKNHSKSTINGLADCSLSPTQTWAWKFDGKSPDKAYYDFRELVSFSKDKKTMTLYAQYRYKMENGKFTRWKSFTQNPKPVMKKIK